MCRERFATVGLSCRAVAAFSTAAGLCSNRVALQASALRLRHGRGPSRRRHAMRRRRQGGRRASRLAWPWRSCCRRGGRSGVTGVCGGSEDRVLVVTNFWAVCGSLTPWWSWRATGPGDAFDVGNAFSCSLRGASTPPGAEPVQAHSGGTDPAPGPPFSDEQRTRRPVPWRCGPGSAAR